METTDKENVVPPENGSTESESSAEKTWDSEKYPAWQKSIGKEYWGNEKLKDFSSMKDVMESIVNPKKKAPEKYEGISDELSDITDVLKSADIGQDDAKKIADVISKHLPKKYTEESLKDAYGADWEQADKDFDKAVGKILTDEKDRKAFIELKHNPILFKFVSSVGKKIGGTANLDVGKQEVPKKNVSGDPFEDFCFGRKSK